jgi:hypothetical protein
MIIIILKGLRGTMKSLHQQNNPRVRVETDLRSLEFEGVSTSLPRRSVGHTGCIFVTRNCSLSPLRLVAQSYLKIVAVVK